MIDSTYVVASDPNTMRDTGPTRNAEYRLVAEEGIEVSPHDLESMRDTLRSKCSHVRHQSTNGLRSTWASGFSSQKQVDPLKVPPHLLVRRQDYTKNVSDALFSPAASA